MQCSKVARVCEDILKVRAISVFESLPPPLTLQYGIRTVEGRLPIDIESVKNIHFECTSHSLFLLIDEGPPPMTIASHLSFSAGRCLQPDTTTIAMVTKMTTERPSCDSVISGGFPVKRMGEMLGLFNVSFLPLTVLMDLKRRTMSRTWFERIPWKPSVSLLSPTSCLKKLKLSVWVSRQVRSPTDRSLTVMV